MFDSLFQAGQTCVFQTFPLKPKVKVGMLWYTNNGFNVFNNDSIQLKLSGPTTVDGKVAKDFDHECLTLVWTKWDKKWKKWTVIPF